MIYTIKFRTIDSLNAINMNICRQEQRRGGGEEDGESGRGERGGRRRKSSDAKKEVMSLVSWVLGEKPLCFKDGLS